MLDIQLFEFKNTLMGKMKPITFYILITKGGEKCYVISCNKGFSIEFLRVLTRKHQKYKNETVNL